jgi:acetylornithine/succinyldiaminopimelate/putrescine aminotransferase
VLWYTGGQLGHVFVDDHYFVEKPLTLISTWDGDEISMTRAYHNLVKAHSGNWLSAVSEFSQAMTDINQTHRGMGTWHAVKLKDKKRLEEAIKIGKDHRILFGQGFDTSLMVCPKPDFDRNEFQRIIEVLKKIV